MSVYREPVSSISPAIESILAQTYRDFELIVMLDDPQNSSAEKYLQSLTTRDERVKFHKNEKNIGLGAALNTAVSLASGRYLARMDTEDRSFSTRFEKQITYLEANPEVDLLFTQWQESFTTGETNVRAVKAADVRHIKKNFFLKSLLLHPTLVVKREVLEKHPYPAMARPEDLVLFLDLIRLGYHFDLLEEVLYEYHIDSREKYQKVRTYSKNLLPHLLRHIPHYWLNVYFWFYVLRVFVEYLLSRSEFIYTRTASLLARVWKTVFRSV